MGSDFTDLTILAAVAARIVLLGKTDGLKTCTWIHKTLYRPTPDDITDDQGTGKE
jgi:hypothetical protein